MDPTVENSRNVTMGRTRSRSTADEAGDHVECTCEFCRTCSASLVGDTVAVCCCPCAVVNLLALAFVKIPWLVGRRCMRLLKKKRNGVGCKSKMGKRRVEWKGVIERDVSLRKQEEGEVEFNVGVGEGEKKRDDFCARVEAERVWMELYQMGHLGFGRVSFTGIQGKIT
ncbi:uncharacterized protein LOC143883118 [Tasmannia lanceolata]|uniref:uncharacterized protein LOC143883118 n=1 Tax=Tasmannia lanceolata TaxID=3420 RepID=UPI00406487FF